MKRTGSKNGVRIGAIDAIRGSFSCCVAEVLGCAHVQKVTATAPTSPPLTLRAAARVWGKIGLMGFGGPAGQIALLHREVVEQRRWVGEAEFQHALSFCVLLPGPEAQQLATYLGWRLHGRWGGVLAGTLFWLPGALLLWGLAWAYLSAGHHPAVLGIASGLRAAVVALVGIALWRMSRRSLTAPWLWILAFAALAANHFALPFPLILVAAGLVGIGMPTTSTAAAVATEATPKVPRLGVATRGKNTVRAAAVWLAVWWLPLGLLGYLLGWDHTVLELGTFFSRAAMVTFGGAYAILPYVAKHAEAQVWLTPGEFLDGLALGETTPGPLVLVLQWVGFIAGWRHPGTLSPFQGGTLGAAATSWATFAPSFLWIFTFAPWVERLRGSPVLAGALRGVSAAVIGVLATLTWQLADRTFLPHGHAAGWAVWSLLLCGLASIGLFYFRWPAPWIVLGSGVLGWLLPSA